MWLTLAILVSCGASGPAPVQSGSKVEGKPVLLEDDGPTLAGQIDADEPEVAERPRRAFLDEETVKVLNAAGEAREDTSKRARETFNPISTPQDGPEAPTWEWPFEVRTGNVDLDGDGTIDHRAQRPKVDLRTMTDLQREEFEARRRQQRNR